MKRIPLHGKRGKGKFALVSDTDFARLSKHRWVLSASGRVVRLVQLHREVLGLAYEDADVDHKNGNPLDNTRRNLRECTVSQNNQNAKKRERATSKFKGVCRSVRRGKVRWQASITENGKTQFIGRFDSEIEAARAYDAEAKQRFGVFARPNFL